MSHEGNDTLIDNERDELEVRFERMVASNMRQLIDELSGAIAYLEDMGITNEDTGVKHQADGIRRSVINAKNIASALRQDATAMVFDLIERN